jgi:protein-S-isoprenylcysteine O-methyltransferase Ste14
MTPQHFSLVAWAVWFVLWTLASQWRARAVRRPAVGDELAYRVLVGVGVVLLFGLVRLRSGPALWQLSSGVAWALVTLTLAGFLFTWWARVTLGTLWSSSVTRKAHHRVVDTGPYGLVRHPIYTGLIVAACSTAALRATWPSLLGAVILTLGFYVKARLEERFLREQLGEPYAQYAGRVGMLVPFVR